jgi:uncharacterized protein
VRKLLIALVFLASPALAKVPNPPPLNGHPVVDAANLFNPAEEEALNQKLLGIEKRSKHQVAVLTVPSLGGYDIDQYSLNAARVYGLGGLDADDGVLVTVAPAEHKARIEVGRGLTHMLTDGHSGLIIQDDMIPRFKANDYPGGINAGVDRIAETITPLTPAQLLVRQREAQQRQARQASFNAKVWDFMMTLFAGLLFGGFAFGAYRLATAPARRRRREQEEAERAEQERKYEETRREAAARANAERAKEAAKRAEERRKHQEWLNSLTPAERAAYDEKQRLQQVREAEAREAREKEARKRRAQEAKRAAEESSYGSSYGSSSYGSSSYGSDSSSSSSSSDFSGGGGSFDGGGASGSW